MKNIINFKLALLVLLFLGLVSCRAQQTVAMNDSELDYPANSYFKDLNSELDSYVGSWQGIFNGQIITLSITKHLKRPYELLNKNFFKDALIVKYEMKTPTGHISQSTLNSDFSGSNLDNFIMSVGTNLNSNNEVNLIYTGGNCSVGIGEVKFQKISATQFSWSYYPGTTTRNDIDCPPGLDYKIYLPETENLVFTKQ